MPPLSSVCESPRASTHVERLDAPVSTVIPRPQTWHWCDGSIDAKWRGSPTPPCARHGRCSAGAPGRRIERVTGDQRERAHRCRVEHPHVFRVRRPIRVHAVHLLPLKGFELDAIARADVLQSPEEPVAVPGDSGVAVRSRQCSVFDVTHRSVEHEVVGARQHCHFESDLRDAQDRERRGGRLFQRSARRRCASDPRGSSPASRSKAAPDVAGRRSAPARSGRLVNLRSASRPRSPGREVRTPRLRVLPAARSGHNGEPRSVGLMGWVGSARAIPRALASQAGTMATGRGMARHDCSARCMPARASGHSTLLNACFSGRRAGVFPGPSEPLRNAVRSFKKR